MFKRDNFNRYFWFQTSIIKDDENWNSCGQEDGLAPLKFRIPLNLGPPLIES